MIVSQAQLNIGDHQVSIAQDDLGGIYCFKHTATVSDWDYFPDLDSATDFIFSRIPNFKYVLTQKN